MTFTSRVFAGVFVGLVLSGGAVAYAAPAAPAPAAAAPAAAAPAPAAPAAATAAAPMMDKKAISKACSDDATAKGLHGKERKSFRSKCKMEKMKGM